MDAETLLLQAGWDLDVSGSRDTAQFRANPHRVSDVLERVGAHREVELPGVERPRVAGAYVSLDPRSGRESLGFRRRVPVAPARLVGHQIDDPVRASQRARPSPYVENESVISDKLVDALDACRQQRQAASTETSNSRTSTRASWRCTSPGSSVPAPRCWVDSAPQATPWARHSRGEAPSYRAAT